MMISPETFYEEKLKGKTADEMMTVIRGLKREIGRLKNIMEHPDYQDREVAICPSEDVQISCARDYLERAKQALAEAGGEYAPSVAEQKAMEFDANIPYISKVKFTIGGYFGGYETRTYTIKDDQVHLYDEYSLHLAPSNLADSEIEPWDKEAFLEQLQNLHIGEWRKNYSAKRFGRMILDGTQWDLEIYFSNDRKPVKIYGSNAYPYNFDRLFELFEMGE